MKENIYKNWKNDIKVSQLRIDKDSEFEFYTPIRHNNRFISYHVVIERRGYKYYIWAKAFGNALPTLYCPITKNYTYNEFKQDMLERDF